MEIIKTNKKFLSKDSQGFTLVELIVVLTILAILAAILVPALLGYIDEAKSKQDLLNAKNCLTAAQSEFINLYSKGLKGNNSIVPGTKSNNGKNNGDVDLKGTDTAKKIMNTADDSPCVLIVGTASATKDSVEINVTDHDRYTIYYVCYLKDKNSSPVYYNGTEWTKYNPRNMGVYDSKNIYTTKEGKKFKLQLYVINYPDDKVLTGSTNTLWDWLKKEIGKDDPEHK